jgi:hypothetical protein
MFIVFSEPSTPDKIIELIQIILSAVVICGVNIIVSGHLLGIVLPFKESNENYIRIPLPPVLDIRINGQGAIAGFACFAISLLAVSLFWLDSAKMIFIERMNATDKPLLACELLSTLISVLICVFLSGFIWSILQLRFALNKVHREVRQVEKLIKEE